MCCGVEFSILHFLLLTSISVRSAVINQWFYHVFIDIIIISGSFSNEIEPWQWYIHGNASTSRYLEVSSDFKNPADTTDAQGIKITIVCIHMLPCWGF
jgi:hypothetical protein